MRFFTEAGAYERPRDTARTLVLILSLLAAIAAPHPLTAQNTEEEPRDTLVFRLGEIIVTATRGEREVFNTPNPVSVIGDLMIRDRSPNSVTDLFRPLPGMDVTGAGTNQARPIIRGQRGQRILLLENGLRLNNFRRQQDFGELPALIDPFALDRVEVVRGPGSVLYGSDAIGGVINLIRRPPAEEGIRGFGAYRFESAGESSRGTLRLRGKTGDFDFQVGGSLRSSSAYDAPAGEFGQIDLEDEVTVNDTGVEDVNLDFLVGYQVAENHRIEASYQRYDAEDAGFGFVDPAAYNPGAGDVIIRYPDQSWYRAKVGWVGRDLGFADRLSVDGFISENERTLTFDVTQPLGPGALLDISQENYSDIRTLGFRAEARKLVGDVLLTYGVDGNFDDSENTDSSRTVVTGFGPPQVEVSNRPQIPNATYSSVGVFLQGEYEPVDRLSLVAGARFQSYDAESEETPNSEIEPTFLEESTTVGSFNAIFQVTPKLSAIGTVGRAFRAPNLVELFFEGPTPEGGSYQVRNADLQPEKSLNVDLGLRYRTGDLYLEGFWFRNRLDDGIRVAPTGEQVQGLDAFQNVNLEEIVFTGVEIAAEAGLPAGFTLGGSYTRVDSEDQLDPDNPVGESFSEKFVGRLRWDANSGRFWTEYQIRHVGERDEVLLENNPLGDVLPAFTVHDLRGGVRLFETEGGTSSRLVFAVTNLTDQLYAELSNASFFRPEPGRALTVSLETFFF